MAVGNGDMGREGSATSDNPTLARAESPLKKIYVAQLKNHLTKNAYAYCAVAVYGGVTSLISRTCLASSSFRCSICSEVWPSFFQTRM